VNCENRRNAEHTPGQAAEKTSFECVCMDEIRLEPMYQFEDFPESSGVCNRPYISLQMRCYINWDGFLPARLGEETLFSRGNGDVEVLLHGASQAKDVCLGSATPGLSDDVQNQRLAVVVDGYAGALWKFQKFHML
jgi:hypothetical protein